MTKPKPTKFVVEVAITTDYTTLPPKKGDIRKFVQDALMEHVDMASGIHASKVTIRSVDLD